MSKKPPRDNLITCTEAGTLLGIGAHAVRAHVRRGNLPLAVDRPHCWLVKKKDVEALRGRLRSNRKSVAPQGVGDGQKT